MKSIAKLLTTVLAVVLLSSFAFAAGIDVDYIKVDGDRVEDGDNLVVDLGETIDIRVRLQANEDVEDVEVSARIIGYEYNDVNTLFDVTRPFDMDNDDTESIDLELAIPVRAEKDDYKIRVTVADRTTDYTTETFDVDVRGPRSAVRVRDVIFSPRSEVVAGRALLAQVRLENIGERDLDDVLVVAEIPQLGISGEVFLDEDLEGSKSGDGESEVTEEIFLRIPSCAAAGSYPVYVTVEFDEFDSVEVTETIRVVEGDGCAKHQGSSQQDDEDRTLITAPPAQNVVAGASGVSFPVTITNVGTTDKVYSLSVSGVESFGAAEITDAAPIVPAGQSKTVYVYVSAAEDAQPGSKVFAVSITDGAKASEIPVTLTVQEAEETTSELSGLKRGLEIGLIVLIVLVVILGLIIGLGKLRDNDDDDEGKSQAYY